MASKEESKPTEVEEKPEEITEDDDKLDIEDIVDPFEELDGKEEPGEAEPAPPAEEVKRPQEEKTAKTKPKKAKNSWFAKKNKPVKEEPKKEEIKEDEEFRPREVRPKRSVLSTILIVMFTAIITAALVLGGTYYYTQYMKGEGSEVTPEKTEDTVVKEESEEKYVYVNSAAGLNFRKEATTISEILAIIPNGTKLKVLDEDDGWYKVEFEDKEGWVSKEFVSEKSPLVYESLSYGFTLEFPESWSGYKIFEKATNWDGFTVKTLYVALPYTDKDWFQEEGIDKGYATLFAITPFTSEQWVKVDAVEGPKPTKLKETEKYVIAWSPGQAAPSDIASKTSQIGAIVKTLELIK
jgi:hypothetical protein